MILVNGPLFPFRQTDHRDRRKLAKGRVAGDTPGTARSTVYGSSSMTWPGDSDGRLPVSISLRGARRIRLTLALASENHLSGKFGGQGGNTISDK